RCQSDDGGAEERAEQRAATDHEILLIGSGNGSGESRSALPCARIPADALQLARNNFGACDRLSPFHAYCHTFFRASLGAAERLDAPNNGAVRPPTAFNDRWSWATSWRSSASPSSSCSGASRG